MMEDLGIEKENLSPQNNHELLYQVFLLIIEAVFLKECETHYLYWQSQGISCLRHIGLIQGETEVKYLNEE